MLFQIYVFFYKTMSNALLSNSLHKAHMEQSWVYKHGT